MPEQYFETITTMVKADDVKSLGGLHKKMLNNYLKYGVTYVAPEGTYPKVNREVKHQSSSLAVHENGQSVTMITVLCCEDEVGEGSDRY